MNKTKWDILAKASRWAKANEKVLVDTHWIGGDPFNVDVYGWTSWNGEKGIITLRNPSDKTQEYHLDLTEALEAKLDYDGYYLSEPFNRKFQNLTTVNGTVTLTLRPFEGKILEYNKQSN